MDIRNVIFYIHSAGGVFGSFHTHEKLVRELSARTNSLVVFPKYTRSPEAKYPTAIEQCYFILSHLWKIIGNLCFAAKRDTLTVAGDSVGGNISIAMTLMRKMCGGPNIQKPLLYYPVTNGCFNTPPYRQFAVNYYLLLSGNAVVLAAIYHLHGRQKSNHRVSTSGEFGLPEKPA